MSKTSTRRSLGAQDGEDMLNDDDYVDSRVSRYSPIEEVKVVEQVEKVSAKFVGG